MVVLAHTTDPPKAEKGARIMRKFAIVLVCLVAFMSYAWAEEAPKPATAQSGQPFTPEQRVRAQAAVKQLSNVVKGAVEQPVSQQAPAEAAAENTLQKKTMTDVADKALDLAANMVTSVVSKMEAVAPKIWKILVVQQYVKGATLLITPWGIVLLMLVFIYLTRKAWKLTDEQKQEGYCNRDWVTMKFGRALFTMFIPMAILFISAIVGICHITESLPYFINPEYYAVKDLLQMLLRPGNMP